MENSSILTMKRFKYSGLGFLSGLAGGIIISAVIIRLCASHGGDNDSLGLALIRPFLATIWLARETCTLVGTAWPIPGRVLSWPSLTMIFLTNGIITGLFGAMIGYILRRYKVR